MFKNLVTVIVALVISLTAFGEIAEAAQKKSATNSSKSIKNKKAKSRTKIKQARRGKAKRYKRTGNGPDIRKLTTESASTEYKENPENGVNSVEIKSGL